MTGADKISIRQTEGGCIVSIKAVPGSSRDKISEALGDSLKITTSAAPEKGKANDSLIKTFAKTLNLDRRDISVIAGHTNPHKEFLVRNVSPSHLRELLKKL